MQLVIDRYPVHAPPEIVADFHYRPDALRRLTPPPVIVQARGIQPLGEGSHSEFTLWFGPLPVRWLAHHVRVNRSEGFTDVQEQGPFLQWEHTHAWRADGPNLTEMTEMVRYEHHPGWKGLLTRLLFAPPMLRLMFAYRRRVIRQACEPKQAMPVLLQHN